MAAASVTSIADVIAALAGARITGPPPTEDHPIYTKLLRGFGFALDRERPMRYRGAGLVFFDDKGLYLFDEPPKGQKKSRAGWNDPGGKIEPADRNLPLVTALHEMREEIGVTATIRPETPVFAHHIQFFEPSPDPNNFNYLVLLVRKSDGDGVERTDTYRRVNYVDLRKLRFHPRFVLFYRALVR